MCTIINSKYKINSIAFFNVFASRYVSCISVFLEMYQLIIHIYILYIIKVSCNYINALNIIVIWTLLMFKMLKFTQQKVSFHIYSSLMWSPMLVIDLCYIFDFLRFLKCIKQISLNTEIWRSAVHFELTTKPN